MVSSPDGNNDFLPVDLLVHGPGTGDAAGVEAVFGSADAVEPRHVSGAGLERRLIEDMQRGMRAQQAGTLLSTALFAGPIGEVLQSYGADARLRVRLVIDPGAELQNLPWERLSDPRRQSSLLAAQPETPFSRYLPTGTATARIPRTRPLPLLCVIENPARFAGQGGSGGTAGALAQVHAALGELARSGDLQITIWTPGEAPDQKLQAALAQEGFRFVNEPTNPQTALELLAGATILHFQAIGVPYPNESNADAAAQYQKRVASVEAPDPTILAYLLRATRTPPLIVLASAAAQMTEDSLGSPYAQTALDLVRHGAAAVVGLHDGAKGDLIQATVGAFYRSLLNDGIVDKALNQIRAEFAQRDPRVPLPILWTSLPDGQLLLPAETDPYASVQQTAPPTANSNPIPEPQEIRGTLVLRQGPESPVAVGELFRMSLEATNTGAAPWPAGVSIGWWTQADGASGAPGAPDDLVVVKGSTGALSPQEAVREQWEQRAPGPGKTTLFWALFQGDQPVTAVRIAAVEPVSAAVDVLDSAALLAQVAAQPTAATAVQQRRVEMAAHLIALSASADERKALVERILIPSLSSKMLTVQRSALKALVDASSAHPEIKEIVRAALAAADPGLDDVQRLTTSSQVAISARRWLQALLPNALSSGDTQSGAPDEVPAQPSAKVAPEAPAKAASGTPPAAPARSAPAPLQDVLYVYEPPAAGRSLTIRVTPTSVEIETGGKSYGGPNHLNRNAQDLLASRANLAEYGMRLFQTILHTVPNDGLGPQTTTLQGYSAALNAAAPEMRIALALDVNDLSLHEQAWEYLKPENEPPLAIRERTPFYRRLLLSRTDNLAVAAPKVKVLAAISSPLQLGQPGNSLLEPLAKLDLAMEREIIERALQRLYTAGLIEYRIIGDEQAPLTLDTLREALEEGYHVLHLVAHGLYTRRLPPDNYYLVMETGKDRQPFVSVEDFCTAMGKDLKLVVLGSCRSAVAQTGDALRGLGPRLVQRSIPAVIAMQDYVSLETAQLFTQHFYDDLARSGRVDMAMAATRRAIYQEVGPGKPDWGIPVLYMNADDGLLLDVDQAKARDLPKATPDVRGYQQLGGRQDPRWDALRQTMQAQAMAMGASQTAAALQRSIGATLGDTPTLAVRQDRAGLTEKLVLAGKLNANALAKVIVESPPYLSLPRTTYGQIAAALNTGKHIILIGPPGTGKTSLAHAICAYAQTQKVCAGATMTTATADWTTFDTIGGYAPGADQMLQFKTGSFLDAIGKGEWLVIDEINRAEIDKAFGELFTVLSGQQVDLPYTVGTHRVRILPADAQGASGWIPAKAQPVGYDYVVHPQWRIIGTMNVYDKSSLFNMSLAFMRRFAFIDIGLPTDYKRLRDDWIAQLGVLQGAPSRERQPFQEKLDRLFDTQDDQNVLMQRRALGPAIVRDMLKYVADRYDATIPEPAPLELLAEAFLLFAVPQLDGLDRVSIVRIYQRLHAELAEVAEQGVLPRIRDLYPFIDDWETVPERG